MATLNKFFFKNIIFFRMKRAAGRLIPPIEDIAVDRLSLTLGDLLHEGTFGRIYQVEGCTVCRFCRISGH